MIQLDHYPEPVSPTGNIAAEGIRNQLGRPNMDRLELLVRESVQNSWDARVGQNTVDVTFATHECTETEFNYLKRGVLAEHGGFGDARKITRASSARMLLISDRGTSGLGGPLRADTADGDEPHDFVDFLRDIGQPPDKKFGGGTFGYGKTALYLKSSIYTILVYSRGLTRGRAESRFMAAALGESFTRGGKKFTGRHWWGRIAKDDGFVDPLLDQQADDVARGLGLCSFTDGELGTTIAILDPDFDGRSPQEAMHFVVHTLLWNFWPKMIKRENGRATMRFHVSCDGVSVEVPDPESVSPFRGFVEAYRALDDDEPDAFGRRAALECGKPQKHLGRLSLRKFPRQTRHLPQLSEKEDEPVVPERCHHVALIRVPELVVKYVEGPELHTEQLEYGGVFRAARDMDRIYAQSEPPPHDDWVSKALDDWSEKRYVGSTFRRIEEQLALFAGPMNPDSRGGATDGAPLGRLGEYLSSLLPAIEGSSARTQSACSGGAGGGATGGRRKSSPRARVSVTAPPRLIEHHGGPALEVEFEIKHAKSSAGTRVTAIPTVVLDSGEREREPPAGSAMPELLGWTIGKRELDEETTIYVSSEDEDADSVTGVVLVSVPPDTSVGVELTASAVEE